VITEDQQLTAVSFKMCDFLSKRKYSVIFVRISCLTSSGCDARAGPWVAVVGWLGLRVGSVVVPEVHASIVSASSLVEEG